MKYTRKTKATTKRSRKYRAQRGASANMADVKKRILQKYSETLERKGQCNTACVNYICTHHERAVCDQTTQFLKEKPAMDSSGFCNNMMAGFPKTCRSSADPSLVASDADCACDRFKRSLYEMDMLKGEIETIAKTNAEWLPVASIVKELFQSINIPGWVLSSEAQEYIRLKRQSGSWKLNI
ncbi:MAG: hypothetical protein EBT07_03865 [Actinobacteria bacterium]|nr:hypothetical protein [Actinomycetota bacterium]